MAVITSEPNQIVAFLDMLAWSEGTDKPGQPTKNHGYDVLVGGGQFEGFADHPRKLVKLRGLGLKSTAAGRYQILARYFDAYRKTLALPDFGPLSQDRIAVQMIREQRAYAPLLAGDVETAIARCANIWASLPGAGYKQHEHKLSDLLDVYERKLA